MTHNPHADASQAHPHRDELQSLQAEIRAAEARDLAASERISAAQVAYDYAMADYDPTAPDHEVYLFDAMKAAITVADRYRSASPPPGEDLAGQIAQLTKERDEVREAFMRVAEAVGVPASERLDLEVAARIARASDLAGQGEPVAWAWDYQIAYDEWDLSVSVHRPSETPARRNIRPLGFIDAAPAPSRPADREEIADAIAALQAIKAIGQRNRLRAPQPEADWKNAVVQMEREAEAALSLLALRDAPRDGGDGWSDDMDAAPKDGSLILLYGKMRGSTQVSWYIGKWWQGGNEGFWVAHSVEVAPSRWALLPPSPNAGDGTQDTQGDGR